LRTVAVPAVAAAARTTSYSRLAVGQAIVFRGLSSSASGARNFMKMPF
jgi:hypothetical protein